MLATVEEGVMPAIEGGRYTQNACVSCGGEQGGGKLPRFRKCILREQKRGPLGGDVVEICFVSPAAAGNDAVVDVDTL